MSVKEKQTIKEKIDVIDFIINTLIEHERKLDNLLGRLEMLCKEQEQIIKKKKYALLKRANSQES